MQTLYDFGREVQMIREAIDCLEVKGTKNASLIVYAYNKCNDIIQGINEIIANQQNPPFGQNGDEDQKEEGEMNGETDSGTAP